MLTITMDFDNTLGNIVISGFRNKLSIIAPTAHPGIPFLDKPDSIHVIGSNILGTNFFNGYIWDIEIHNIVLPKLDIDGLVDLKFPDLSICGPF